MTNYEIWKNLGIESDKDEYGGEFSPEDYNYLAKGVNAFLFERETEDYRLRGKGDETIFSTKFLRSLSRTETIVPAVGIIDIGTGGDLTYTYSYWGSMRTSALYNGQVRDIVLVDQVEFDNRRSNILSKPFELFPVAVVDEDTITVYPTDIPSVEITYLSFPATPYFDYYTNAYDHIQYLAAGATYTLQANEVYRDGTAAGDVNSITVELAYKNEFHHKFQNEMLNRLSARIRDTQLMQHTEIKKQQEDQV